MASSSKPKRFYDVFLSFRGMDVRNNFLSHLYKALVQNGIYTFRDREELRKGDQISSALIKAIEQSCIAIIVFSEDYASSKWCLEEVAKIMECKEQTDLIVLPVFYKVDPREVRGGRESYGRALAKHESKFGKDSEKVKRWKKALSHAGSLSGWHLNDGDDESKIIQRIVRKISTHLDEPLHVAEHPIGIDSRVVKLKSMLNLESKDDVLMLGLWGQGGIGKTTLGKAIYNDIFRQFEGSSFLANVRENSKDCKGLVTLQEQLLNDTLLLQERLVVSNVARGINLIQHRLHHKRVLVILDDVDDLHQLRALAGNANWFGNGSRILVTTRDSHLLTPRKDLDHVYVYEVKVLDDGEARELLSKHAFPTYEKIKSRIDLVDSVLNHAKGLPLALEVMGSLLCGTTEDVCESILKGLSRNPNKTINNVLKVSYDGLDENEKEIFLHIACFFKGWAREHTKKVLDSCDLQTAAGFDTLIKRSLIRIESGILQMHDLIQSMGMDVVKQECRDDPRKRSRLWLYNDVLDVLLSDEGDCAVKALVLEPPELKELSIHPNAFTKMTRLRLLILHNVHNSFQGPICLPNELRWIEWAGCGPGIPEFSFNPKKLVGLDMSNCNITKVVEQFKDFHQLKYIKLSDCESLISTPNLLCTPNLKELYLLNCKSLVEAHDSIAYHDNLQVLHLSECSKLSIFPDVLTSKSLRDLWIANCTKFEKFPDIPHKLEGLKELYLQGIAIKELPASIENLVSLERMAISCCKNLVHLPSNIYKLQMIEVLVIWNCTNLIMFPKYEESVDPSMTIGLPNLRYLDLVNCNLFVVEFLENLSCFPFLRELGVRCNNITTLPTTINKRYRLSQLAIDGCHQLQGIPKLPPFLNYLDAKGCDSLQTNGYLTSIDQWIQERLTMVDTASLAQGDCAIKAIVLEPHELKELTNHHDAFTKMRRLRLLIVHNGHNSFQSPICPPIELRWFQSLGRGHWIPKYSSGRKKLVGLDMSNCSIPIEPNQFKDFQNLGYINFSGCESLVCTPDLSCTPNLKELDLQFCKSLVEAHKSIADHDKLEKLNLKGCSKLSIFPNELRAKHLQILNLAGCTKFERFPNIPHNLEVLRVILLGGTAIIELPASIENLVSLKHMGLHECKKLATLPSSIYKLRLIENLILSGCTNFIMFPKFENSADSRMKVGLLNLMRLNLEGCSLCELEFLENFLCFPFLRELCLGLNTNISITGLPTSITNRRRLRVLRLTNCHHITALPPFLRYFFTDNSESLQRNGDLTLIHYFVRRGLTMAHISSINQIPPKVHIILHGGDMPEWVLPIEDSFASFMASKDLYDKFLGLVFCFVIDNGKKERQNRPMFEILPQVNGEWRDGKGEEDYSRYSGSTLDRIGFWYFTPNELWGEVKFGQIDGSYVQFSLTVRTMEVKKWGLRIICKPLEDDLKVKIQENWLINPALFQEVVLESIYSKVESLVLHEHSSSEEDQQEDLLAPPMSYEELWELSLMKSYQRTLPQGMQTRVQPPEVQSPTHSGEQTSARTSSVGDSIADEPEPEPIKNPSATGSGAASALTSATTPTTSTASMPSHGAAETVNLPSAKPSTVADRLEAGKKIPKERRSSYQAAIDKKGELTEEKERLEALLAEVERQIELNSIHIQHEGRSMKQPFSEVQATTQECHRQRAEVERHLSIKRKCMEDNETLDEHLSTFRSSVKRRLDSARQDSSSKADPQVDLQDCQTSIEEHSQIVPQRTPELFFPEASEPRPRGLLIRLAEMSMAVFARCFCC